MSRLSLSLAACDYDHVRDLFDGTVRPRGIEVVPMVFDEPHHIFHRMANYGEFDVAEMSFGGYIALLSRNEHKMVGIPVFTSRVARHSAFYVPARSRLRSPRELEGKRIGVPQWAQTATVYARGWLAHEVGVDLKRCAWVQTGVDEPAREEIAPLSLPEGFRVVADREKSLSQLLLDEEVDCVISALPPKPFREGSDRVRRLIPDFRAQEERYYRDRGIFPIMHLITVNRALVEARPWVTMNLYEAFVEAKDRSLARARKVSHSIYPIPWGFDAAREAEELFGADFWPYGLEPNRETIEAFLEFGHEQGLTARRLEPESLFVPETLNPAKT